MLHQIPSILEGEPIVVQGAFSICCLRILLDSVWVVQFFALMSRDLVEDIVEIRRYL